MHCLLCHAETKPYFNYGRFTNLPYGLVRCTSCRLIQTEPMPTEEFLREWYQRYDVLGEREPYYQALSNDDPWSTPEGKDITERFALVRQFLANRQSPIANRNDKRLAISDMPRVLDVGSGHGLFLALVKQAGWQGIGIELNERAAAVSREHFGVDVRTGTVESVGLPRESFDLVTLWDILEHVCDPRRLLERTYQLMKPGGFIFIDTPNTASMLDWAVLTLARLGFRGPGATFYGLHHLTLWNPKNIRKLLEAVGFRVHEIRFDSTPGSRVFRGLSTRDQFMRFGVSVIQMLGKMLRRENKMILIARIARVES